MDVSKVEAARLAGVSRSTIQRYVRSGRLSAVSGRIDTSELIRVFGALPGDPGASEVDSGSVSDVVQGDALLQARVDHLESEVELLRSQLEETRRDKEQLRELLDAERQRGLLIEHQRSRTWIERVIEVWKADK